ncbi:MAG TPA: ferritin-like domain-containing protein [Chloroflexota bacterium]|nr:ferritin-like domain-containing protein [Chloroflexota bacterium]
MTDWLDYFTANRARPRPTAWHRTVALAPPLRDPLVRSLQRFQVGEQGAGRHLRRAARASGDARYAAAVDLFLAEEQAHAKTLAALLGALGAPVLTRHWSDGCFIWLRHRAGLHGALLVLMVAEIIGEHVYRLVHATVPDAAVRAAMARILADEAAHIAFHCDALRRGPAALPAPARQAVRCGWRLLFRGACLVVLLDQRAFLATVGEPPRAFWRATGRRFAQAEAHVFGTAGLRPAGPVSTIQTPGATDTRR